MPLLSYFFQTSPSLCSLYAAINLCEFAATRLCTFFPKDGMETESQHCYKYTDTKQLMNPRPDMAQCQVNIKAVTHTFP